MNAPGQKSTRLDKLPPHELQAEQGVLGCVLLAPGECLKQCEERFSGDLRVFYDLRHQRIYRAYLELHRAGMEIDVITLQHELKKAKALDDVGGLAYLSALPDAVPSAANLEYYIEIVWSHFLARRRLADAQETLSRILEAGGLTEPMIEADQRQAAEFGKLLTRAQITPKFLKRAGDFGEQVYARFFGGDAGEVPGKLLPIGFPLKIRRQEMTVVTGDNKCGKSTFLNAVALHLAAQGEKIFIASLEMPVATLIWMLVSHLLGRKHLPDSSTAHKQVAHAISWLHERVVFYDFTGIADWRELLDTIAYATKNAGVTAAIVDSQGRIGIMEDDLAQQGAASARFAQSTMDFHYHLFMVIHEKKGDSKGKEKVRGSKKWLDDTNNILGVARNEAKGEKADKVRWEMQREKMQKEPNQEFIKSKEAELAIMRQEWDTKLTLLGQRYPGTQQNGSKYFWFDPESFQYRDKWEDTAVNWLEQWEKKQDG